MKGPRCPYCNMKARLVTGRAIHPNNPTLWSLHFWACDKCDAYVGCHPGTKKPLGTLANATLRGLRIRAHAIFDQLYEGPNAIMSKDTAYSNLKRWMFLDSQKEAHIGMFDETFCLALINKLKYLGLKEEDQNHEDDRGSGKAKR